MSFAKDKTTELWRSFMPKRKEISNKVGEELYSMQMYPPLFFDTFNAAAEFEKWAAIEVTVFNKVPDEMETITLPAGLYAVFLYKGDASSAAHTFQYILQTWFPNSIYSLDNRPHFEILREKYKRDDSNSEEEICIPIKMKK